MTPQSSRRGQAGTGTPAPCTGVPPQPPAPGPLPAPGSPGRVQDPAGGTPDASVPPAGRNDEERAAQRKEWARLAAAYARGRRGGPGRCRAARGQLPDKAGMIRRPTPGGDAA